MEKFAEMQLEKWCEVPMKTERDIYEGQWVTSHVKFLRSGDRFRARKWDSGKYTIYMATSDPYLRITENNKPPSLMEIANNPEAINMIDNPEPPFWTVNYVKER